MGSHYFQVLIGMRAVTYRLPFTAFARSLLALFLAGSLLSDLCSVAVPAKKSEPAPLAQEGQLPEMIIRGEGKGVVSEKPLLAVEINPDESVLPVMELEEDLLKRQPESLRDPRAGYSASLLNARTILPARIRLAKSPVKIFHPLREILSISPALSQEIGTGWELVITDMEGRAFRKFSGGGLPPGSQIWDGRSNRGEMISPGKTYSTVIHYKDIRGESRNLVGEPFFFHGVVHQESKGLFITLANSSLFETTMGVRETETIGESGLALIQEAADYIKRYYFTYPIKVESYAVNAALANSRAATVSKLLASLLLLPKGEIPTSGAVSDRASERIVILISNR